MHTMFSPNFPKLDLIAELFYVHLLVFVASVDCSTVILHNAHHVFRRRKEVTFSQWSVCKISKKSYERILMTFLEGWVWDKQQSIRIWWQFESPSPVLPQYIPPRDALPMR